MLRLSGRKNAYIIMANDFGNSTHSILARIKEVLAREADAIQSISVNENFAAAVMLLLQARGKVITVGIGKAGIIAQKFAATLCSTGTPAVFLHPAEAAHGDLGVVTRVDVMVAFSTSGKSREVLEVLELCRHLGIVHIIGVTSHVDSELRKHCELIVDMGIITEACPLGLTPTASIAAMLAISDSLAIALMEQRGFTKADYGRRHHGGYLGRIAREDNLPRS